jgi:MYXO-CTERM domain-containing protein
MHRREQSASTPSRGARTIRANKRTTSTKALKARPRAAIIASPDRNTRPAHGARPTTKDGTEEKEMKSTNMKIALIAPAAALLASAGAQAVIVLNNNDTVNLGALMSTESDRKFIIGDKMFTFEYVTSPSFNIQNFDITAKISEGANEYGLHNIAFDLTGPFVDGGVNDQTVQDMNLQYKVEVLPEYFDRGIRLKDCSLSFNGSSGGQGSFARVAETIYETDTGHLLGNLNVYNNFGPPPSTLLQDSIDFRATHPEGYRSLECNKNLKFFANTDGGFASCSFVRQEFSQMPAPGAVALLGIAGITGSRRRRA